MEPLLMAMVVGGWVVMLFMSSWIWGIFGAVLMSASITAVVFLGVYTPGISAPEMGRTLVLLIWPMLFAILIIMYPVGRGVRWLVQRRKSTSA